jgi:hypothetical protein
MLGFAGQAVPFIRHTEIVGAAAGMGVEKEHTLRLDLKRTHEAHQQDVLEDIRKIAGMELVAVIQGV